MGLDDFASAEELKDLQEEGLQKNADPQDEDLFDFPDMTLYEWDSSSKEEEEEEAAKAEEQQPAAALPSKEAQGERSEQETPTAAMSPDADPSLDEDIFNFDELFTAAESEAGNDMVPATDLFEPDTEAGDPFEAEQDDQAQRPPQHGEIPRDGACRPNPPHACVYGERHAKQPHTHTAHTHATHKHAEPGSSRGFQVASSFIGFTLCSYCTVCTVVVDSSYSTVP